MTEPGAIIPPRPGWWPRTGRVGTHAGSYGWDTAATTGATTRAGRASGSYGWTTARTVGLKPVPPTVKGVNVSAATTVTIPAHNVGDIIVIYAYAEASASAQPVVPSPAGTVPAWNTIDNTGGANLNASGTFYFVATATNHTSGTWTNAAGMAAAVLSGQGSTPIGGHAESGSTAAGSATAPAITMVNTDATSVLLHFFGYRSASFTWSAAPAGYTKQNSLVGSGMMICVDTKDVTTSDGSVAQANSSGSNIAYRGATVEIRSH